MQFMVNSDQNGQVGQRISADDCSSNTIYLWLQLHGLCNCTAITQLSVVQVLLDQAKGPSS